MYLPKFPAMRLVNSTEINSCLTALPSLRLMMLTEKLVMFPLGVAGGSQEMTKVVSSVDSASKLVTALDTKNKSVWKIHLKRCVLLTTVKS